ncbi:GIY-YIG nuclease family protein [Niabella pedocola]|uniref:GIY-YIG nuclease family protein n=1 Tax=Niabella pedocola TaxID=1752077 RepID=UPI00374CEAB4
MHFVYILYSPTYDKFYIGETSDVEGRTLQHNSKHYHHASTAFTSDWKPLQTWKLPNRTAALIVEAYLKSMKSKKYLRLLCSDSNTREAFNTRVFEKFQIEFL